MGTDLNAQTVTRLTNVKAGPPDPSTTIMAVDRLNDQISRLDEVLGALEERMAPFMKPVPEAVKGSIGSSDKTHSAVVELIMVHTDRLLEIQRRVEHLLDFAEV